MTKDAKGELYELVELLHARGWTAPTIGRVLGYSDERIRQVLTDLNGQPHVRFRTLADAVQSLEPDVGERILRFRQLGLPTSGRAESVGDE